MTCFCQGSITSEPCSEMPAPTVTAAGFDPLPVVSGTVGGTGRSVTVRIVAPDGRSGLRTYSTMDVAAYDIMRLEDEGWQVEAA